MMVLWLGFRTWIEGHLSLSLSRVMKTSRSDGYWPLSINFNLSNLITWDDMNCMLSRQDSLNFLGTVITKLTVTWCSVQK